MQAISRFFLITTLAVILAACNIFESDGDKESDRDRVAPVISLIGDNPQTIEAGEAYTELGATASDNLDGDVSASIIIDASTVDTTVPGDYTVSYDVSDAAGNAAVTVTRTVLIRDTTPPVISLLGDDPQIIITGNPYNELGATALDSLDGDLTRLIDIDASAVDSSVPGEYLVTYDVSDSSGNAAQTMTRTVLVQPPVQHAPEISNVMLSPDTANHMEGNGSVVVSAEITFRDDNSDVENLWVERPDGTTVVFDVEDQSANQSITVDLDMPTDKVGFLSANFWLVDTAGNRSESWYLSFPVIWNGQSDGWTKRLSDVPQGFWDVVWDGTVFVAVGDDGAILTSPDGVDWERKDSGVEDTLMRVAAFGSDIVAVGYDIVMLSTDHGDSWTVKDRPELAALEAVALNSSQYVIGGVDFARTTSTIRLSENRGETWEIVEEGPIGDFPVRDLAYGDGLFVATTWQSSSNGGRVKVSADGRAWNEILVSEDDEATWFAMVMHDGDQFAVAGYSGVSMSVDGLNWTQKQTPLLNFDFLSAATDGSKLMLAGAFGSSFWGYYLQSHWPAGIASTDGGLTWEFFGIDEGYLSLGMAFGNGRFVSVGRTISANEDGIYFFYNNTGAIYSTD